jgi:hypothetical protein
MEITDDPVKIVDDQSGITDDPVPFRPRSADELRHLMIKDALDQGVEFFTESYDFGFGIPLKSAVWGITGAEIPTLTEFLREKELLLPEGETHTGGWLGEFASAAGNVPGVAAAAHQVPRALGNANSILMDIFGAGTSAADDVLLMTQKTAQGLSGLDNTYLGRVELTTDDEIYEAARMIAKRDIIGKNKPFMRQYEKDMRRILKDIEDDGTFISDVDWPEGIGASVGRVLDEIQKIHKVSPTRVLNVLKKRGGLHFEEDALVIEAGAKRLDAHAQTENLKEVAKWRQDLDEIIYPVADALRRYISPLVGGKFERAAETWTRRYASAMDTIGAPHQKLLRFASKQGLDREAIYARNLKRAIMDLHRDPDGNMELARWNIRQIMGDDGVKMFDDWMNGVDEYGKDIRQHVLRHDIEDLNYDKYFIHMQKFKNKERLGPGMKGTPYAKTSAAMKERSRVSAWDMSDEVIDSYENPFVSHMKYLQEHDMYAQLAKRFGMRPSLIPGEGGEGGSGKFFNELTRTLTREGFDTEVAKAASDYMHNVHLGTQRGMSNLGKTWMSAAYAGTLGNPVSATLNYHDPLVAMVNMGVKNTIKGIFSTNKKVFGKSLQEMGIGRDQSTGEFMMQYQAHMDDPKGFEKAAEWVDDLTTKQFKVSGFTASDRHNKSIVLRTALNWMKDNAKKDNLYKSMKDMAEPWELQKIRKYLKDDVPFTEMPKDVQDLVEELAFVKLGEQQLISIASSTSSLRTDWLCYQATGYAEEECVPADEERSQECS